MSEGSMSLERRRAVAAMRSMGWTADRGKMGNATAWKFTRPDTGGLWDAFTVKQCDLSMAAVAGFAMNYGDADDLISSIAEIREEWLSRRFLKTFKEITE